MRKIIFMLLLAIWMSFLSGCGKSLYSQAESVYKGYIGKNILIPYHQIFAPKLSCKEGKATVCGAYAQKIKMSGGSIYSDKLSYICLVSDKNGTITEMYHAGFYPPEGYTDPECPKSVRSYNKKMREKNAYNERLKGKEALDEKIKEGNIWAWDKDLPAPPNFLK